MRIAFVNPQGNFDPASSYIGAHPDFGGQLVYVRELALALATMGHQADILTRRIVDPEWPEFAAAEDLYPRQFGVRVIRLPCGPKRFLPKEELWPYLSEWVRHILRWYRSEGFWPDLWTGHYADGGLCAALLQEQTGIPFTFTGHSLGAWKLDRVLQPRDDPAGESVPAGELEEADTRYRFGARIAAERTAMTRAAAVITSTMEERYDQYRHPAYADTVDARDDRHFAVIPPGVNLEIFDAGSRSPREGEIRQAIAVALERDIAPDRRELPAVIAWNRLDPKKNYQSLVHAFAQVAKLRKRANLILITRGLDDPLRQLHAASPAEQLVLQPLVAEVERSNLWGAVSAFHLAGQDALAALYRWGAETHSVFCLPSLYEPFGLSLIEAMAAGLPVVATSNGGPQETTADGKFGLLADPSNTAELAGQLVRLITNRGEWRRFAQRGRKHAVDCYSWHRSAQSHIDLATEILNGERTGDLSFPLPEFVRRSRKVKLPKLERWEIAELARAPRSHSTISVAQSSVFAMGRSPSTPLPLSKCSRYGTQRK